MSGSVSFDNLSSLMRTSESFSDLNTEQNPIRGRGTSSVAASTLASSAASTSSSSRGCSTLTATAGGTTEELTATNKHFGLGEQKRYFARCKIQCFFYRFFSWDPSKYVHIFCFWWHHVCMLPRVTKCNWQLKSQTNVIKALKLISLSPPHCTCN